MIRASTFRGAARATVLLGVCALAACAQKQAAPDPKARYPGAIECRTVVLFDMAIEEPDETVPAEWRAYSGEWGNGAWDGRACHEIVVEVIRSDGTARVADMQGKYPEWNIFPAAFRREARFTEDGALQFERGRLGTATFKLENGILYGDMVDGELTRAITLYPK